MWKRRGLKIIGYTLHGLVLFVYVSSGLVAPPPGVVVLLGIWAGLLVLAIKWNNRHWWVFATPFIALAALIIFVQLGSLIFGWTA